MSKLSTREKVLLNIAVILLGSYLSYYFGLVKIDEEIALKEAELSNLQAQEIMMGSTLQLSVNEAEINQLEQDLINQIIYVEELKDNDIIDDYYQEMTNSANISVLDLVISKSVITMINPETNEVSDEILTYPLKDYLDILNEKKEEDPTIEYPSTMLVKNVADIKFNYIGRENNIAELLKIITDKDKTTYLSGISYSKSETDLDSDITIQITTYMRERLNGK